MDSLVFHTSALLNFGHRGELAPLLIKFAAENRILTTSRACAELTDPDRHEYYAALLKKHFSIQNATASPLNLATLAHLARILHPGEISVILLAAETKGIAVLDERAARREAQALDLRCTGTLGLIHQGLQRAWLTESESLARVVKLCDAGFFIPRPAAGQTFADYFSALE